MTNGFSGGPGALPNYSSSSPSSRRATLPDNPDVGDFFAPFFDVTFYKNSEETPDQLELNSGDPLDTPVFGSSTLRMRSSNGKIQEFSQVADLSDLHNYRVSLSIDVMAAAAYQAVLLLQPPYEDAIKLIDAEVLTWGTLMEIQWGYLNIGGGDPILSDLAVFHITEPSVSLGDQVTIKITGIDMLTAIGQTTDRRCSWPRTRTAITPVIVTSGALDARVVTNKSEIKKERVFATDLAVLEELASKMGLVIDPSQIPVDHTLLTPKPGEGLVQATDDLTFFQRVCAMNDLSYRVDGNRVVLLDQGTEDLKNPLYSLLWYRQPIKKTDIPMISFESNSIASLFGAQGAKGFLSTSHNLDDDRVDAQEHSPADAGNQPGNQQYISMLSKLRTNTALGVTLVFTASGPINPLPADPEHGICSSGKIWSIPDERPNAYNERINRARENSRQANTTANVVIPGHPSILPMTIVNVVGVGEKFGGTYRVMRVAHNLSVSGYTTRLNLLRSTISGDPSSPADQSLSTFNSSIEVTGDSGEEVEPTVELEVLTTRQINKLIS